MQNANEKLALQFIKSIIKKFVSLLRVSLKGFANIYISEELRFYSYKVLPNP